MILRILLLFVLFGVNGLSQKPDPDIILENVKNQFDAIEDYQVDIKVKVDIDFLKMSDRKATLFYKKPDKIHIESDNFAMLPKSGLNFSPLGFLDYKYSAFYVREDTIDGVQTSVVKVIPLDGTADVILTTLWIDTERNLILQVESARRPQGTFTVGLEYSEIDGKYWLPSSIVFVFTIDPGLFPGRFLGSQKDDSEGEKKDLDESMTGTVYLNYSNYKVNIGLSDELFEELEIDK